jgi:hypothetical protein
MSDYNWGIWKDINIAIYATDIFLYNVKDFYRRTKWKIWNKNIKLAIDKKYNGNDEFHKSLDMDIFAMMVMTKEEQDAYLIDLRKRRNRMHEKTL